MPELTSTLWHTSTKAMPCPFTEKEYTMRNRKRMVSILAGVMAAIMLLTLVLSVIPAKASAASSSEIKKQIAALKKDREAVKE